MAEKNVATFFYCFRLLHSVEIMNFLSLRFFVNSNFTKLIKTFKNAKMITLWTVFIQ